MYSRAGKSVDRGRLVDRVAIESSPRAQWKIAYKNQFYTY